MSERATPPDPPDPSTSHMAIDNPSKISFRDIVTNTLQSNPQPQITPITIDNEESFVSGEGIALIDLGLAFFTVKFKWEENQRRVLQDRPCYMVTSPSSPNRVLRPSNFGKNWKGNQLALVNRFLYFLYPKRKMHPYMCTGNAIHNSAPAGSFTASQKIESKGKGVTNELTQPTFNEGKELGSSSKSRPSKKWPLPPGKQSQLGTTNIGLNQPQSKSNPLTQGSNSSIDSIDINPKPKSDLIFDSNHTTIIGLTSLPHSSTSPCLNVEG
ncbi:hypothetical protein FXO38_33042 [Capsicum annuum]|nr:hypothetical protein FXO38_33042 [Capsicum annuum]KAF3656896.1 hypothetical protein FXO37_15241 [Capsicum annuum]